MTTDNEFELGVEIDRIEAREISKVDCFGVAEEATSLPYQDDELTSQLGLALHLTKVQAERAAWQKVGDTYNSMPWAEFLFIVIDGYGFEVISLNRVTYTPSYSEGKETYLWELVAAHKEKKLLLYATSYTSGGKETVSGGHVYGRVQARENRNDLFDALNGCSYGSFESDSIRFDIDVRTGLITKLMELNDAGEFINWRGDEWLWLLCYPEQKMLDETRAEGRDLRMEKEAEFFATSPDWVRLFTGRS